MPVKIDIQNPRIPKELLETLDQIVDRDTQIAESAERPTLHNPEAQLATRNAKNRNRLTAWLAVNRPETAKK